MEAALERLEQARVKAEWAAARNLAGMSYEEQQAAHAEATHWRLEYEFLKGMYRKALEQSAYRGMGALGE